MWWSETSALWNTNVFWEQHNQMGQVKPSFLPIRSQWGVIRKRVFSSCINDIMVTSGTVQLLLIKNKALVIYSVLCHISPVKDSVWPKWLFPLNLITVAKH